MSYGRARYFFFDNAEPIHPDPEREQARIGLDLEEIIYMALIWEKTDKGYKYKEYVVYLKNRVEPLKLQIFNGRTVYQAWREYCEAKNV